MTHYVQHLDIRIKYGADTILHDWTPLMFCSGTFLEGSLVRTEGHPVWYDNLGNLDMRGD